MSVRVNESSLSVGAECCGPPSKMFGPVYAASSSGTADSLAQHSRKRRRRTACRREGKITPGTVKNHGESMSHCVAETMQVRRRERTTQIAEDLGWMHAIALGCTP